MNLLILSHNIKSYSVIKLSKAAKNAQLISEARLTYSFSQPLEGSFNNYLVIPRFTGIHWDDFDFALLNELNRLGARVLNGQKTFHQWQDKMMQMTELKKFNFPILPFLCRRDEKIDQFWDGLQQNSPWRLEGVVLKSHRGNQGKGVIFCDNPLSLYSILQTFWAMGDKRFFIQPWIKDFKEYRFLILGDEILGVIEKSATSESHFRRDDYEKRELQNFDPNLVKKIRSIGPLFGLDFYGVDIIQKDGQYYFLEVNCSPGFEMFDSVTDQDTAANIINYLLEKGSLDANPNQ